MTLGATAARPPRGLQSHATPSVGVVKLSWDFTAASYLVFRSVDGASGSFDPIGTTTYHSYVDEHLIPGFAYAYRVAGVGSSAAFTSTVVATPLAIPATGTTSADSRLNVLLPAALAGRLNLDVAPAATTPPIPAGMNPLGGAYDVTATPRSGASVHLPTGRGADIYSFRRYACAGRRACHLSLLPGARTWRSSRQPRLAPVPITATSSLRTSSLRRPRR